ncbi:MAG: hypothetical protein C4K60_21215 [Ideonella sp. MAG2]|nr:MAG: hypothetical protein C4K60_21215 [Ideonella sp. MAG2]
MHRRLASPTALGARLRACAVKLPLLAFGSLWSNSDGEYVFEARGYARHALALRASAPKKSPRATACDSAGSKWAAYMFVGEMLASWCGEQRVDY